MSDNIIEIQNVFKQFKGSSDYAVNDVSLTIEKGCFITILGTSGSGKTTLLKMINRIYELTSGRIYFKGVDIHSLQVESYRKQIGYVIQQIGLFPHMTVADNIAVVPKSLRWDKAKIARRVDELLGLVHLEPNVYRHRFPSQLSGGQQQRVGLARALAVDPEVMLMDEPFGAIDAITRQSLQEELSDIHKATNKTILFVTHDLNEAFKLGGKVIIMDGGRIQQFDTPYNIAFNPANGFVERLTASYGILEKLKVLKAEAIARPASVEYKRSFKNLPHVAEDSALSDVLSLFLERGAPIIFVEGADGQISGQIEWDYFKSISNIRTGEIEYYV
jgi:osmoprotectant transport system ATP-binding protein